jgi:hypothetical protein
MREIIDAPISSELYENVSDWVNFSLNEYFLYKMYDQFQLSLSSVLLGLRVAGMEESIGKLVSFIQKENLANVSLLQICIQHMVAAMNNSDEEILVEPPMSPHRSTAISIQSPTRDTECSSPETQKKTKTRKAKIKISLKKSTLNPKRAIFVVYKENSNNINLHKSRQLKISDYVRKGKSTTNQKNKKN